ncbi:MAG: mechanosensitive ion channel family protein [Saprospiraceae bacterium]|nr:mechanosensitive ion channel family protein [Saprospiraceae bacterium]MBK8669215.1 mechanosensitive ion channel family protein [Saprospiraceae bacterium]
MLLQATAPISTTVNFVGKITELSIEYAPKLIGAVVVYLIGSVIIKWIGNMLIRVLNAKKVDISLQSFLSSFVKIMLNILLLLTVFGMLGVNLTSFAAILAGLAVGVGAALNGTLGNFAGGVMMLLFKPFKLGDLIEAQGHVGNVKEQGVFNTFLLTPENKTVILANGALSTGTIVNYTSHGNLRVDLAMAIDPAENIENARKVATDAMLANPKVLKTPAPEVSVQKVGDGMVTLAIRPYCAQEDYWDVYFGTLESVKNAFDAHKIAGPIPHRVIINK